MAYRDVILADSPYEYWPLDDAETELVMSIGEVATVATYVGFSSDRFRAERLLYNATRNAHFISYVYFGEPSGSYIYTDTTLGTTRQRTVEFWFKSQDVGRRQTLYFSGQTNNGIHIYVLDNLLYAVLNAGGSKFYTTLPISAGRAYYVAVMYNGDTGFFRCYANDEYETLCGVPSSFAVTEGYRALGASGTDAFWHDSYYVLTSNFIRDGSLGHLAEYDEALTKDKLMEHYDAGRAFFNLRKDCIPELPTTGQYMLVPDCNVPDATSVMTTPVSEIFAFPIPMPLDVPFGCYEPKIEIEWRVATEPEAGKEDLLGSKIEEEFEFEKPNQIDPDYCQWTKKLDITFPCVPTLTFETELITGAEDYALTLEETGESTACERVWKLTLSVPDNSNNGEGCCCMVSMSVTNNDLVAEDYHFIAKFWHWEDNAEVELPVATSDSGENAIGWWSDTLYRPPPYTLQPSEVINVRYAPLTNGSATVDLLECNRTYRARLWSYDLVWIDEGSSSDSSSIEPSSSKDLSEYVETVFMCPCVYHDQTGYIQGGGPYDPLYSSSPP